MYFAFLTMALTRLQNRGAAGPVLPPPPQPDDNYARPDYSEDYS